MSRSSKILFVATWVLLVVLVVLQFTGSDSKNRSEPVYVDIERVFNEFEMTSELQGDVQKKREGQMRRLDSMELRLKLKADKLNSRETLDTLDILMFERDKEEYFYLKDSLEKHHQETIQKYDQQILKQLNQYIKEFGEEHEYEMILGGASSNTVIYARESRDITDELIEYVNKKYQGVN